MRKFLCIVVALCFLGVTAAHAEYFTIKGYHVEITFGPEGDATFVEEITVEFSEPRHGIAFCYAPRPQTPAGHEKYGLALITGAFH
jgi:hypothetical protein